jgi:phosphoglycerate dehydrogenase-like enzyme
LKQTIWLTTLLAAGAVLLSAANRPFKILMGEWPPATIEEFRAAVPEAHIVVPASREEWLKEVVDADAIYGQVKPELLRAARKLRWIQATSAGVDHYLVPELRDSNIVLTNAKIIQGPNIADHAFALLLSLTRCLNVTIPLGERQAFRTAYKPIELNGRTAVVIGVGGIGQQIALRAHAFGMQVIGVDPKDIPYSPYLVKVVPPDRLDTVLPQADVVFVSAPLTRESTGMVGDRQFEIMKKGAYFIAVSRGRLYKTDALVKALDSRRLAGAGLDVTDPEPLPKGHPLWKFDNVVITPHLAGSSDKVHLRRIELVKENMKRFAAGEPLLNVVDKQKGY